MLSMPKLLTGKHYFLLNLVFALWAAANILVLNVKGRQGMPLFTDNFPTTKIFCKRKKDQFVNYITYM
jgi:hypothetical protein